MVKRNGNLWVLKGVSRIDDARVYCAFREENLDLLLSQGSTHGGFSSKMKGEIR